MRSALLITAFALFSTAGATAETAAHGSGVPVESGPGPLTPWLALASVALVAALIAAQWLISRGPRR
jgi:uncharacterized protein YraI